MSKNLTEKELEEIADNLELLSDIEVDSESAFEDSDSDISDVEVQSEHSDHETDSEIEGLSDNEHIQEEIREYFYGRNGFKWSKNSPAPSRTRKENIIMKLPGLKGNAAANKPISPLDAWSLLFTDDILEIIIRYTNEKITQLQPNYGDTAFFTKHIDKIELKALLGLLYLTGIFKSAHEDVSSLWTTDCTGRDIFRLTMSLNRFLFLLTALRFDDAETRLARKAEGDKLAPISELFQKFIVNCRDNYTPYAYTTVDEMLVGFRGKCSFRVYIKSKPQRYGIKVLCLCDSKTHYLLNAFVYTGKNVNCYNPKKLSIPTLTVLELVTPIMNTNRNVTGDNWFTSMELLTELKQKGLTNIGTVRKNKREMPLQFLPNKNRDTNSSLFGFTRDITLLSFVPKKNKSVNLLSSMHHAPSVNNVTHKPEIIEFYNSTKSGVDSLDQKCAIFSCNRRTKRWPLAIFYALINIAGVNSRILFAFANVKNVKMPRRLFLKKLGLTLVEEHMKQRSENPHISREIRQKIKRTLNIEEIAIEEPPTKRRRCNECPSTVDRKHSTYCFVCKKTFCKQHLIIKSLCVSCNERL